MLEFWRHIKYFKREEFDSPDAPGSGDKMSPRVVFMLDSLRALVKKPLPINSGFRTVAHNDSEGGAPHSAHLDGEAVDIGTRGLTKGERKMLVIYAIQLGFTGIGVAKTFIHLDIKPRRASWRYEGHKTIAIPVGRESEYV